MKKELYICNGHRFYSFEEVENYCRQNNYRITNTETIRKNTFLISIVKI